MEKSTHLKTVICGVALVALASVRPTLAQEPTTCPPIGEGSGVGLCITQTFEPGIQTVKYDFGTHHAIKITVDVLQSFDLQVGFIPITQGELDNRLNPELAPANCIPYDGATSNTNLGTCGFYHVFDPLPERDIDFRNDVIYTVLWDFPTFDLLHNIRLYRAPLDGVNDLCTQGYDCYAQDITGAVLAVGDSNSDPGVRGSATGFSDFEAVDRVTPATPDTSTAARVWIGLKNSDDVGTRFDLKAVVKNGAFIVSSGELLGALGGSSGFNNAKLRTIPLSLPADDFVSGDTISLELLVRNSCLGTSHNSGTARLWFNNGANSRVDEPGAPTLYLVMPGTTLDLRPSDGTGPKKTKDVFVGARDPLCTGDYKSFGIWSGTVPN